MFNAHQFYPTPKTLAFKLFDKIDNWGKRTLEPSAGKGDLIEHYMDYTSERYRNKLTERGAMDQVDIDWNVDNMREGASSRFDVIELDKDLQATLTGKGFNVIADDFLHHNSKTQYDTIVMNPPFSKGVDHVLKAWDTLFSGEVAAIVNAETVRNVSCPQRMLLQKYIEKYGSVEFVSNAFAEAERKTTVEVAIIHLVKKGEVAADYIAGLGNNMEDDDTVYEDEKPTNALSICGRSIDNTVLAYDMAVEHRISCILADQKATYFEGLLVGRGTKPKTDAAKDDINKSVDDLRKKAWDYTIYGTEFANITTSKVRKEIQSTFKDLYKKAFTGSNVREFMVSLLGRQNEIIEDCIEEVFDIFTKYHDENRVHCEGWKSNDYFFASKKVVLPYAIDGGAHWAFHLRWTFEETLMDIEQALRHVEGTRKTEVQAVDAIKAAAKDTGIIGVKIDSTYFSIRCFKKGTIHLMFKDLDLLQKFNVIAGRKKGWLPKGDIDKVFLRLNA